MIMSHLPTEHGQRFYLHNIRYELIDDILVQTNVALETTPTVNITENNALILAAVRALQESVEKRVITLNTPQCLAAMAGEEDQAIEIKSD